MKYRTKSESKNIVGAGDGIRVGLQSALDDNFTQAQLLIDQLKGINQNLRTITER